MNIEISHAREIVEDEVVVMEERQWEAASGPNESRTQVQGPLQVRGTDIKGLSQEGYAVK